MPYPAVAVANNLLHIAKAAGESVDPMKVQKLVYFAHGWHLGYDRGALSAELAQAWRWGPVFPDLYHAVKLWGNRAIAKPVRAFEFDRGKLRWSTPSVPPEDIFAVGLIERVWEVYGHMSGLALSQLTHERGGPWQVIRAIEPGARNLVISNHIIREYFARKIQANVGT